MSGVELIAVVGVVASAAQLIAYSLKVVEMVSELYSQVKDAPKRIVQYTTQINQLIAACRTIQEYKSLDSPLIDDQLRSTFGELKHLNQALTRIRRDSASSKSKRVWNTIVSNKERILVACFERLEKEKTALILCINVVHIQTLKNIGTNVDILIERGMANPYLKFVDTLSIRDKDFETQVGRWTLASNSATTNETALMPAKISNQGMSFLEPESESDPLSPSNNQKSHFENCARSKAKRKWKDNPEGYTHREQQSFEYMRAYENATQYNGDENETVNAAHSYYRSISFGDSFQHNGNRNCTGGTGAHKHKGCEATGNSIQHNGNIRGRISDTKIRERAGKKLERENSNRTRPDERGSEGDELQHDESDDDSY